MWRPVASSRAHPDVAVQELLDKLQKAPPKLPSTFSRQVGDGVLMRVGFSVVVRGANALSRMLLRFENMSDIHASLLSTHF